MQLFVGDKTPRDHLKMWLANRGENPITEILIASDCENARISRRWARMRGVAVRDLRIDQTLH